MTQVKVAPLLVLEESEGRVWSYPSNSNSYVPGALRLIRIDTLLAHGYSEYHVIHLVEFRELNLDWQMRADDLPTYAAISHVWDQSDDVMRISRTINRPLYIDTGENMPHVISWHGLIQAATAAKQLGCDFLWLDLLCLDQRNDIDKKLQIKKMTDIYMFSKVTLVMFGGVSAAQGVDKEASWMDRAWTLQETIVGIQLGNIVENRYGLFDWPLFAGSVATRTITFTRLDSNLNIAIAPLHELMRAEVGEPLGIGTLFDVPGYPGKSWQVQLDLQVKCLGRQQAAITALERIMGPLTGGEGVYSSAIWRSLWIRTSKKEQDLIFSTYRLFEMSGYISLEVGYQRSLKELLREIVTQLITQMGRLAVPSWLCIGHNIPVDEYSGLIPTLPTFIPHSGSTYIIGGVKYPASQLLCSCCENLEFDLNLLKSEQYGHLICCRLWETLGVHVTANQSGSHWSWACELLLSSPYWDDGYDHHKGNETRYVDSNGREMVRAAASCQFDGTTGPLLVIVGHQRLERLESGQWSLDINPIIYFLDRNKQGVFQRVGTGELIMNGRRFDFIEFGGKGRRHIGIGGRPGAQVEECNCEHWAYSRSRGRPLHRDHAFVRP